MAIFHYDNLAKNLPDCYKKDTSSNNYKILEVERQANITSRTVLESINNILDISNATGKVLDMYGQKYGQLRGNATDAQYRTLIKAKIARSFASGSYKSIIDALCFTFDISKEEILIIESEESSKVTLAGISLDTINEAGFSAEQAEEIIKEMLPASVALGISLFNGTFEFSDSETEYNASAGFADTEGGWKDDEAIGGYLGYTATS